MESYADITTMPDYARIHIFDAVTTCGHYQGRLLLILILHNVMHDITSTLPVGVLPSARRYAKWLPHVNRRRAPGVIRLGFNGYGINQAEIWCFVAKHKYLRSGKKKNGYLR